MRKKLILPLQDGKEEGIGFLYKQPHLYARLGVDMQIWQLDDI